MATADGRIFISYRRQETAWPARQLYEALCERYGVSQVFKDVDNIAPGEDFVERVSSTVASCQVMLAMLGPRWASITDEQGGRRLDDPDDFVRLEVGTALARGVLVVPILVDGARMPRADELPPDLAGITRRQAVEISPTGFNLDRLFQAVDDALSQTSAGTAPAAAVGEPGPPVAEPDGGGQPEPGGAAEPVEPEVPEPELPGPEVPEPELPGPEVVEPEVSEPEVSEPEVPEPEVSEPEAPGPEAPEPGIPAPEVPGPEVPGPEVPGPLIPGPEVPGPEVPGPLIPGPEVPTPPPGPGLPTGPEVVPPAEPDVVPPAGPEVPSPRPAERPGPAAEPPERRSRVPLLIGAGVAVVVLGGGVALAAMLLPGGSGGSGDSAGPVTPTVTALNATFTVDNDGAHTDTPITCTTGRVLSIEASGELTGSGDSSAGADGAAGWFAQEAPLSSVPLGALLAGPAGSDPVFIGDTRTLVCPTDGDLVFRLNTDAPVDGTLTVTVTSRDDLTETDLELDEVTVPGNASWVQSAFTCVTGEQFRVSATGITSANGVPPQGAGGADGVRLKDGEIVPGPAAREYPHRSLLGVVDGSDPMLLGSSGTLTCPADGRVELQVNDGVLEDNTGELSVTLSRWREPAR